jgi:ribosomal protein S18 acetylase RimI-like enzyme
MPIPTINPLSQYPIAELYAMFRDIYSSSAGMSETLEERYPTRKSLAEEINSLVNQAGTIALAAEIAGRPVGYLTIKPRRQAKLSHTADLNIGVIEAMRRAGIGNTLLKTGITRALASAELEIIYLMVRADNTPALRLYQKNGFSRLATLKNDIKIGNDYFDGLLLRRFVCNSPPVPG